MFAVGIVCHCAVRGSMYVCACLRLQMLNIRLAYLYQFYYENSNENTSQYGLKGFKRYALNKYTHIHTHHVRYILFPNGRSPVTYST
jgi:hypothetical protein